MIIELQIEGNDRKHYLTFIQGEWIELNEFKNYCDYEYKTIGIAISRVWSFLHEMYDFDLKREFHRKYNCNMVDKRF